MGTICIDHQSKSKQLVVCSLSGRHRSTRIYRRDLCTWRKRCLRHWSMLLASHNLTEELYLEMGHFFLTVFTVGAKVHERTFTFVVVPIGNACSTIFTWIISTSGWDWKSSFRPQRNQIIRSNTRGYGYIFCRVEIKVRTRLGNDVTQVRSIFFFFLME